jgi:hypothetical protein
MPEEEVNNVTESRFRLRTSFMEDRFDKPAKELNDYLEKQGGLD